jgi:hypothetical protein
MALEGHGFSRAANTITSNRRAAILADAALFSFGTKTAAGGKM